MDTLFFPPFVCKDPFKCDSSGSFWWFGQRTGVWTVFLFFLFLIRLVNSYLFIFCVCLCGLILSMFFQSSCCIVQCIIPNANCRPSCEHNLKDVLEVLFSSLIFFLIYLVRLRVNNSQYTMGFWWKMLYFLIPELSNDWK